MISKRFKVSRVENCYIAMGCKSFISRSEFLHQEVFKMARGLVGLGKSNRAEGQLVSSVG